MAKIKRDLTIFCNNVRIFSRDADLLCISAEKVDVIEFVKDMTWECTLDELLKVQRLLNKRIEAQNKLKESNEN